MARLSRLQLFTSCSGAGFTALRLELGWLPPHLAGAPHPQEMRLSRATAASLAEREQRQWLMLTAQLFGTGRQWRHLDQALDVLWQAGAWREELIQLLELMAERADRRLHPLPWALPVPFCVHGHYTRAEIEAAFGVLTTDTPGSTAKACSGTNPAIPACCSWLSTRVKPSSPPPPAPANWPSA